MLRSTLRVRVVDVLVLTIVQSIDSYTIQLVCTRFILRTELVQMFY